MIPPPVFRSEGSNDSLLANHSHHLPDSGLMEECLVSKAGDGRKQVVG
jgi:hypothetical protein